MLVPDDFANHTVKKEMVAPTRVTTTYFAILIDIPPFEIVSWQGSLEPGDAFARSVALAGLGGNAGHCAAGSFLLILY